MYRTADQFSKYPDIAIRGVLGLLKKYSEYYSWWRGGGGACKNFIINKYCGKTCKMYLTNYYFVAFYSNILIFFHYILLFVKPCIQTSCFTAWLVSEELIIPFRDGSTLMRPNNITTKYSRFSTDLASSFYINVWLYKCLIYVKPYRSGKIFHSTFLKRFKLNTCFTRV